MRYFAIFLELLKKDLCNLELKEKDFFGTYFERILDLVDISCGSKKIDSKESSYILIRPQNFAKSLPYF